MAVDSPAMAFVMSVERALRYMLFNFPTMSASGSDPWVRAAIGGFSADEGKRTPSNATPRHRVATAAHTQLRQLLELPTDGSADPRMNAWTNSGCDRQVYSLIAQRGLRPSTEFFFDR